MTTDDSILGNDHDPDATSLDQALQALRRGKPVPSETHLTEDQKQMVDDLAPWLPHLEAAALDELSEEQDETDTTLPVRDDDPIALMLGLVADPEITLDGHRLAYARKKTSMNLAQFCDRLNERGWTVTVKQAFHWEMGKTVLAPALVDAIADELAVDRSKLLVPKSSRRSSNEFFDDELVQDLLTQWAKEHRVSVEFTTERVKRELDAAVYRNKSTASAEELLGVLRILKEIPNFLDPNAP